MYDVVVFPSLDYIPFVIYKKEKNPLITSHLYKTWKGSQIEIGDKWDFFGCFDQKQSAF